MKTNTPSYQRHRFPSEIISHAVWLYHRFCLSFREVEELLAERGIVVTYETIRQWCQKFSPDYARRRYCQLKSNWADFLPWAGNMNAEQSMSYEFVFGLNFVQIRLT
jgi:transposase-like protein